MKYILSVLLLCSACAPLTLGTRCNKDADRDAVDRAVAYMERTAFTVNVRYDKKRNIAVVSGYDINRRFLRSARVHQSCKL